MIFVNIIIYDLNNIYELIGNNIQIIKNTTENIKVGKHIDKGFNFIKNSKIFIFKIIWGMLE